MRSHHCTSSPPWHKFCNGINVTDCYFPEAYLALRPFALAVAWVWYCTTSSLGCFCSIAQLLNRCCSNCPPTCSCYIRYYAFQFFFRYRISPPSILLIASSRFSDLHPLSRSHLNRFLQVKSTSLISTRQTSQRSQTKPKYVWPIAPLDAAATLFVQLASGSFSNCFTSTSRGSNICKPISYFRRGVQCSA